MERYTEKHYDGNGHYLLCSGTCETLNCGDCGILDKIVDRLAAYEDTGLTPEEVQQMRWIPVEERLPNDSEGAVLLTNEKTVITGYRNQLFGLDGKHGIFAPASKKGGGYMQVTHWMPLPEPHDRRPSEGEA